MTQQIGRFHVRKRLGGGGFGEVFLAEDPTIGRQVAIKVFRPKDENLIAFATSSNTEGLDILRTRFLNEAKILARLDEEPHVVSVLEFGELADGTPYYVMPYLPQALAQELGKDVFDVSALTELADADRPRALPLETALDAVEQALKGLAAAHAHGLVHRDIKPGNLMRSEKGLLRIVDFGIAKAPDGQHSTVSHLGMGSRNYMAPEQRESAKHVDARADVFSTGVVAYRALTGKLPSGRFADPNVVVPALGTAMNAVLLKMLAQDKAERPRDASEALALFQHARKTVGTQYASEQSGTWAGEQGSFGLRDELKPLKARIIAVVSEQGFLSEDAVGSLRALAAIANLDEPGLSSLIETTLRADKALSAKAKLGDLIRQAVKARGIALDERTLKTFHAAGEAVGWNAAHLHAVMQAALTDHSSKATAANPAHSSQRTRIAPFSIASAGPMPGNPPPADNPGAAPNPSDQVRPDPDGRSSRRLPMALVALLVLGATAYGLYEWRQSQSAVEQPGGTGSMRSPVTGEAPRFGITASDYATVRGQMLVHRALQTVTMDQLRSAANKGDGEALFLLSAAEADNAQSRKLLQQAVEAGFIHAEATLGELHLRGLGGNADVAQGLRLLEPAARRGDGRANLVLGTWFAMNAPEPERDLARAEALFAAATAQGYQDAPVWLAWIRREQQPASSLDTLRAAAAEGSALAMRFLAAALSDGIMGLDIDRSEALALYRRCADLGDRVCAGAAGRFLAEGAGIARADVRAAEPYLLQALGWDWQSTSLLVKRWVIGELSAPANTDIEGLAITADENGFPEGLAALAGAYTFGRHGRDVDLHRAATLARAAYARFQARNIDEAGAWPMFGHQFAQMILAALSTETIAAATADEREQLEARWGAAGSSLKQFTVPLQGASGKQDFLVYLWDSSIKPNPAELQFQWAERHAALAVPQDVRDSFEKLQDIALENKVSYTDLAVYALGEAQKPKDSASTQGQPTVDGQDGTKPP